MAGLDEVIISSFFLGRTSVKLPWEKGQETDNQEVTNGLFGKASLYGSSHGDSIYRNDEILDGSGGHPKFNTKEDPDYFEGKGIVSQKFSDDVMTKVALGEISLSSLSLGHGHKGKHTPKQPVNENKIVDMGFEEMFARNDTSLKDVTYGTLSRSHVCKQPPRPNFFGDVGKGDTTSSLKMSFPDLKSNMIVDVGFEEFPKTWQTMKLDETSLSNKIADIGLDTGSSYSSTGTLPNLKSTFGISMGNFTSPTHEPVVLPWDENKWEKKSRWIAEDGFDFLPKDGISYLSASQYSSPFSSKTNIPSEVKSSLTTKLPFITSTSDKAVTTPRAFLNDFTPKLSNKSEMQGCEKYSLSDTITDAPYVPSFFNDKTSINKTFVPKLDKPMHATSQPTLSSGMLDNRLTKKDKPVVNTTQDDLCYVKANAASCKGYNEPYANVSQMARKFEIESTSTEQINSSYPKADTVHAPPCFRDKSIDDIRTSVSILYKPAPPPTIPTVQSETSEIRLVNNPFQLSVQNGNTQTAFEDSDTFGQIKYNGVGPLVSKPVCTMDTKTAVTTSTNKNSQTNKVFTDFEESSHMTKDTINQYPSHHSPIELKTENAVIDCQNYENLLNTQKTENITVPIASNPVSVWMTKANESDDDISEFSTGTANGNLHQHISGYSAEQRLDNINQTELKHVPALEEKFDRIRRVSHEFTRPQSVLTAAVNFKKDNNPNGCSTLEKRPPKATKNWKANVQSVTNPVKAWMVKTIDTENDYSTETETDSLHQMVVKSKRLSVHEELDPRTARNNDTVNSKKDSNSKVCSTLENRPKPTKNRKGNFQPDTNPVKALMVKTMDNDNDISDCSTGNETNSVHQMIINNNEVRVHEELDSHTAKNNDTKISLFNSDIKNASPNDAKFRVVGSNQSIFVKKEHVPQYNPLVKRDLPKPSKVILVEPEDIRRERRKRNLERNKKIVLQSDRKEIQFNHDVSDTESSTLSDDIKCVKLPPKITVMEETNASDTENDVDEIDEDTNDNESVGKSYDDESIAKQFKAIMKTVQKITDEIKFQNKSCRRVACKPTYKAVKKKKKSVGLNGSHELTNDYDDKDLCKRCKMELSRPLKASTKKSKGKKDYPVQQDLKIVKQTIERIHSFFVPNEVYYKLMEIMERLSETERKDLLMRSTSLVELLKIINEYMRNADPIFIDEFDEIEYRNGLIDEDIQQQVNIDNTSLRYTDDIIVNDTHGASLDTNNTNHKSNIDHGQDMGEPAVDVDNRKVKPQKTKWKRIKEYFGRLMCCMPRKVTVNVEN